MMRYINQTYYLSVDASTGKITRRHREYSFRTHRPIVQVRVSKETWKGYRSGDTFVPGVDVDSADLDKYIRELRIQTRKRVDDDT